MEALAGDEERLMEYGEVLERYQGSDGYIIDELIEKELSKLEVPIDALTRPFCSMSGGEQTKAMLCALFLRKNQFLLIDEPTNHLDAEGREVVAEYLRGKVGFILVSHDRAFLDRAVDRLLILNRDTIRLQRGNFSSWYHQKEQEDEAEREKNERLKKEIKSYESSARQAANWSDKLEKSKKGQRIAGLRPDRGAIGHKAAKMMKRSLAVKSTAEQSAEERRELLKDVEELEDLKIHMLPTRRKSLVTLEDFSVDYGAGPVFVPVSFEISPGDRVFLGGENGSGKSSLVKAVLGEEIPYVGSLQTAGDLVISSVPQDSSFLRGALSDYIETQGLDEPLFKAILRKLDFSRTQFDRPLSEYSLGQKKKLLLATSLSKPAHLYVWDEPLNYLDVFSRMQLLKLLKDSEATILLIEHDRAFVEEIATKKIILKKK